MAGFRAWVAGMAVTLAFTLAAVEAQADPADARTGGGAHASMINGSAASIKDYPWQVALTVSRKSCPRSTTRARYFCGGSLVAPDLVLTAAHCVASYKKRDLGKIEVVAGRTHLNNDASGETAGVRRIHIPVDKKGRRLFRFNSNSVVWDVALLRLKAPLSAPTIKVAGADEAGSWKPGQLVRTAGWGVTNSSAIRGSNSLRAATQVMLPDGLCRRTNRAEYSARTMNCLGGPAGNTSSCFGDSGSPLVASVGDEARVVGLTSFGDITCFPRMPSIDTRVAGSAIRGWIRKTALALTGVDVIGKGGTVHPRRSWCRVPNLRGLTVGQARAKLTRQSCRLGQVSKLRQRGTKRGRVLGGNFVPGWLAPTGAKVKVWVRR